MPTNSRKASLRFDLQREKIRLSGNFTLRVGCYRSHITTTELRSRCINKKFLGHWLGTDREFQKSVSLSFIGCQCIFLAMSFCRHMCRSLCLSRFVFDRDAGDRRQSRGQMRLDVNSIARFCDVGYSNCEVSADVMGC